MPVYSGSTSVQQSVFLDTNCTHPCPTSGFDSGHISSTDASSPSSLSDNIVSESGGDSLLGSSAGPNCNNYAYKRFKSFPGVGGYNNLSAGMDHLPSDSSSGFGSSNLSNCDLLHMTSNQSFQSTTSSSSTAPSTLGSTNGMSNSNGHSSMRMPPGLDGVSGDMGSSGVGMMNDMLGGVFPVSSNNSNVMGLEDGTSNSGMMMNSPGQMNFSASMQQAQLCEMFDLLDMQDSLSGNGHPSMNPMNSIMGGLSNNPNQSPNFLKNNMGRVPPPWAVPPPSGDQMDLYNHLNMGPSPGSNYGSNNPGLMSGGSGKRAITGGHSIFRGPTSNGMPPNFPPNLHSPNSNPRHNSSNSPNNPWKQLQQQQQQPQQFGMPQQQRFHSFGSSGGGMQSSLPVTGGPNNPWNQAIANQKMGLAPASVNSLSSRGLPSGCGDMLNSSGGGSGFNGGLGSGPPSGMMMGGGPQQPHSNNKSGMSLRDQFPGFDPSRENCMFPPGLQQHMDAASASVGFGSGQNRDERFSRKVFVGGLPPDIDEEEITAGFKRFGDLVVDWPHKAESRSYFPPKGYCFLLFQQEFSVQQLIEACIMDDDKYYWCVSSATMKNKPVQVRPWCLADSDYVMDGSQPLDPRKTIFVGGVPRPLKAFELARIMARLYGDVCYAGIDTDPELKYPKGAGRVAFSSQQSYIAAINARFVQLQHGEIDKRVEVKPYVLDDQMCDECQGSRCAGKFAPYFCANVTCLQYYCEQCWAQIHSRQGREYHKPLVKEGADRPRTVPFRW